MKINKDLVISDTNISLEQVETNKNNIIDLQPITLFSGDSNGNITLSSSAENFTYLEIYYRDSASNYYGCEKVYSPNKKHVCLWSVYFVTANLRFWFDVKDATIDGTSIKSNSTGIGWLDGAGNTATGNENRIYITKVIGYK